METLAGNDHLETQAPPTHLLLEIVEHILHNNVFEFDGEIFRQILGTAMGTPITNVFMGWLEQQLLSQSPWHINTSLWKRFTDDIVMLWFKGEQQLLDFMDLLNDQHPIIKFMANYGTVDIPYLDVSLSITDGHISTDLHVKETDAYICICHLHPATPVIVPEASPTASVSVSDRSALITTHLKRDAKR